MSQIDTPQSIRDLPTTLIKNMVMLSSSGFGVVVALAWNEVIKKTVETYVDPYVGKGGGLLSLLIYAIAITLVAVLVTMQLTGFEKKVEKIQVRLMKKEECEEESSTQATTPKKRVSQKKSR